MEEGLWWQTGVIYQIYPRSFSDANGNGVGDLRGIINRLDYIAALGIDAIWLSPIYPSSMADFGYDVSNYDDVDPVFGTLDDFDELLSQAHQRDIRIILDLVLNHTSDEHPWFLESRSSRSSSKRDWYLWLDPAPDGGVPNNWTAFFGGSTWELDEGTGQFYMHLCHAKQPDLNWRNPEVRAAIYDVMRLWFDRGVDGFRIDALWLLTKDENFSDNPETPSRGEGFIGGYMRAGFEDHPEVQEIVSQMRTVADEYRDRVLMGEIYLPLQRLVRYYGENLAGIQLPFNFGLVTMTEWGASSARRLVAAYEAVLPEGAWPNWVLGNHDQPRIASRAGEAGSRVAQMLLLTLRGTPICYFGDELGMRDGVVPDELTLDPQAAAARSRDGARTPMQWNLAPHAGFTKLDAEPWLPVGDSYRTINAEVQDVDPRSHLSLFRQLLELRKEHPALHLGSQEIVDAGREELLVFVRQHNEDRVLVILNFGSSEVAVDSLEVGGEARVLCSTLMDRHGGVEIGSLQLRPNEGLLLALN